MLFMMMMQQDFQGYYQKILVKLKFILDTTNKYISHYYYSIIRLNSVNVLQMLFDCYNLKIPSDYGAYFFDNISFLY